METLKFLITTWTYPPYHIGGDAIHVKYLSEELAKQGHEVHVMYSLDAYSIKRKFSPEKYENYRNLCIHALKSPYGKLTPYKVYAFGKSSFTTKKFDDIISEVKPDIVHHHNISLLGYNFLKKRGNYLNLYTAHDYWLICQRNDLLRNGNEICHRKTCTSCVIKSKLPPQQWRKSKKFKEAINDIDSIIAPSRYMKTRLEKEINSKIVCIPNFVPPPPKNIKPSGYNNFFLYVGVLEEHRGVKLLLDTFKDKQIKQKLIIVGKGRLEGYINEFIQVYDLRNKVLYLNWFRHESLWPLYNDALSVIMPSICEENCPMVALEALSVGTPVIGSNNGGLPEIVGKIDKKLIFCDGELKKTILEFDKNKYPAEFVKKIYETYYCPGSYMNKYIKLLRRSRY